jgi:hypothetical protein
MQSVKRAPRPFQPYRDNLGANLLFPKVALATNEVVFGICESPRQAQCDNRMLPQRGIKPEPAKRHYTAKRMIDRCFACAHSIIFARLQAGQLLLPNCFLVLK